MGPAPGEWTVARMGRGGLGRGLVVDTGDPAVQRLPVSFSRAVVRHLRRQRAGAIGRMRSRITTVPVAPTWHSAAST